MTRDAERTAAGGGAGRLRHLLLGRHPTWVHVLIVLLCAAVGFALAVQVRQTQEDTYATMRQDDIVRLLDELSVRNRELTEEGMELRRELGELESGSSSRAAAQEAAAQQARVQGILAGALPVTGPGVEIAVHDPSGAVSAPVFVTVLEELRNAGAEAIELNDQRITASSWLGTRPGGLVVSGVDISAPYVWRAIGDPQTLAVALDIPGGALASIRAAGAAAEVTQHDDLAITSVQALSEPEWATPAPVEDR
ncbi:DUF881 domain-containing protein [Oceanitalea stevensii]|uniref:DUF881 domain-containing protein n=1 Tax=Oceanitalea stevensii TaxID=2763072 RepID=A0ABR8Z2E9_9MICO|nr:DUF881 domain-containing protein [Oceanitalea stevensii]MBD8062430.1 DUF881 domain-containing protein [Oceanitalea stevensii]